MQGNIRRFFTCRTAEEAFTVSFTYTNFIYAEGFINKNLRTA